MIDIQNLCFSYGRSEILKDISINFEKGRFYAVIGPNGCGKTTLINVLSRLKTPNSGKMLLDGEQYENIKRKDFAKEVALLPQGRNVPNMSVYDLVACGRFPYLDAFRMLSSEDENIVMSALKMTNTENFAGKSVKRLSGGERQRVYIAMLLAQTSPYVLLDEPTTHLDISAKLDVMKLLCDIKQSGKCVIAVLHDLDLALKFADEIILMADGEIVSTATSEKTVKSGNLQTVFGVKCKSISIDGETEFVFKL